MRATPLSTTYRMPGTVSDVSATFVASTTRRVVWGCEENTRCCSAAESREKSGTTSRVRPGSGFRSPRASAVSRISRSPGRNTSTSPGPSCASSRTASTIASVWSRTTTSPSSSMSPSSVRARGDQGPVADLDGVHPSGHLDDRGLPSAVVGEVPGEPLGVDGRRRDDQLQVGASRQQSPEVAEQEVDVEAPLVGLVDDDRVVAAELPVALELGEQDAVGHHLDPGVARRAIGEAHLVADLGAELRLQLRGQALGDRAGGDPSRLGVPDQAPATALSAAQLEADLRQLRGLPRAGLAGHDHDLVIPDRGGDVVAPAADRQLGREGDVHNDGDCLPPDRCRSHRVPAATTRGARRTVRFRSGKRHRGPTALTGPAQEADRTVDA